MDVTLLFVAQSDDPSPILPENNELVWGVVSAGLLLVAVVIALVLVRFLVRYLIATRRIAERAASDAAALREELGQRQG